MASFLKTISEHFATRELCNSDDCIAPGAGAAEDYTAPLFDIAIATIFAREVLEGCIIIGQYRTVIYRSPDFQDETRQKAALKAVSMAAFWASLVAVILAASITVGLYFAGKQMSNVTAEIVEGVSKLVAAVCVLQLSGKVPKWLGLYANKHENEHGEIEGLDERSIKFNVAWNLWREVAECGVFLIPYMLGNSARSIPVSAVIGTAIGFLGGYGTYWASSNLADTKWLAFFLANLTGWLAVGLFTGGCYEFEEAHMMLNDDYSSTYIWKLGGSFWSHKNFPMVMIKPFGYSHKRTIVQFCAFWFWIAISFGYHYYKYLQSEKIRKAREAVKEGKDIEEISAEQDSAYTPDDA